MGRTIGKFDFESGAMGAKFVVVGEPLSALCLSDGEVDEYLKMLKDDLDAVAVKMKRAIKNRPSLIELRNA